MLGKLRTVALVAALALGAMPLAGCSDTLNKFESAWTTVSGASVPSGAVIAARTAFNVAEAAATNYTRLPRCNGSNGPVCRDPALRQRISAAVHEGRDARTRLAALQRANPGGVVPIADYNTLVGATDVINSLTAAVQSAAGK